MSHDLLLSLAVVSFDHLGAGMVAPKSYSLRALISMDCACLCLSVLDPACNKACVVRWLCGAAMTLVAAAMAQPLQVGLVRKAVPMRPVGGGGGGSIVPPVLVAAPVASSGLAAGHLKTCFNLG
jgi:hypothetical protein